METLSRDWWHFPGKRHFTPAKPFLAFFSFLYGAGVRLRLGAYRRSFLKKRSLPGFVVSIGNLTVGGTGKTPATCMLANWATSEGYRVAILSRGYGGKYKSGTLEVSDGFGVNAGPEEAGDEPYLLAYKLRGVPVITARQRYLAGLAAIRKFGSNFLILDDGFQHLALERDLDLVLMDALCPLGNGHLLPWGPLREPPGQLKRADVLIFSRLGQKSSNSDLTQHIRGTFSGKPCFTGDHIPERIVFPGRNEAVGTDYLRGKRVVAFAGIARPALFRETLTELGGETVSFRAFRDHHAFRPAEIRNLIAEKERLGADCLLTTEKDWIRLGDLGSEYSDLAYLTIRFSLLPEGEAFYRVVKDAIKTRGRF